MVAMILSNVCVSAWRPGRFWRRAMRNGGVSWLAVGPPAV